jgi:hypothetical protein
MTTSVNTNTAASGATNVPVATEIIASDEARERVEQLALQITPANTGIV